MGYRVGSSVRLTPVATDAFATQASNLRQSYEYFGEEAEYQATDFGNAAKVHPVKQAAVGSHGLGFHGRVGALGGPRMVHGLACFEATP